MWLLLEHLAFVQITSHTSFFFGTASKESRSRDQEFWKHRNGTLIQPLQPVLR
jgi:hypothetical protein